MKIVTRYLWPIAPLLLFSDLIITAQQRTQEAPSKPPNIVFIMSDDHAAQAISL